MRQVAHAMALLVALASGIGTSTPTNAQQAPDPRIADLVAAGKLRVAIGLGTPALAIKEAPSGEPRGPAMELGRALAARMGVVFVPVEYQRPGTILDGIATNAWDVAFLVIHPVRAEKADFSQPYMQSDFTYLVPAGSSIRNVADVDQPGVHVAVPRGDASDLELTRVEARRIGAHGKPRGRIGTGAKRTG
jgi:polar amino acid transport system substrate-binding protein